MRHRLIFDVVSWFVSKPLSCQTVRHFSLATEGFKLGNLRGLRGLIRISGHNKGEFLQGIITNDIGILDKDNEGCQMYTHVLNSKGRYMHDMFLFTQGENYFLDVDAKNVDQVMKLLKLYALRRKIDIVDISGEFDVWVRMKLHSVISFSFDGGQEVPLHTLVPWRSDPRVELLGERTIAHRLDGGEHVNQKDYTSLRYSLGVAEGDTEIPKGSIPLEYNIDGLRGISFTKGCYVGQELMARTHFQGAVRKRLMPFKLLSEKSSLKTGLEVVDDEGKMIGAVRGSESGLGIAHIRLKNIIEKIEEGNCNIKSIDGIPMELSIPNWWPNAWRKP